MWQIDDVFDKNRSSHSVRNKRIMRRKFWRYRRRFGGMTDPEFVELVNSFSPDYYFPLSDGDGYVDGYGPGLGSGDYLDVEKNANVVWTNDGLFADGYTRYDEPLLFGSGTDSGFQLDTGGQTSNLGDVTMMSIIKPIHHAWDGTDYWYIAGMNYMQSWPASAAAYSPRVMYTPGHASGPGWNVYAGYNPFDQNDRTSATYYDEKWSVADEEKWFITFARFQERGKSAGADSTNDLWVNGEQVHTEASLNTNYGITIPAGKVQCGTATPGGSNTWQTLMRGDTQHVAWWNSRLTEDDMATIVAATGLG